MATYGGKIFTSNMDEMWCYQYRCGNYSIWHKLFDSNERLPVMAKRIHLLNSITE